MGVKSSDVGQGHLPQRTGRGPADYNDTRDSYWSREVSCRSALAHLLIETRTFTSPSSPRTLADALTVRLPVRGGPIDANGGRHCNSIDATERR